MLILFTSVCLKLRGGFLRHTRGLACSVSRCAIEPLNGWQKLNDFNATCNPFRSVLNPASDGSLFPFGMVDLCTDSTGHPRLLSSCCKIIREILAAV